MITARSGLFIAINIIVSIFAFLIYNVSSSYNVAVNVSAVNSNNIIFNNAAIYVRGQGTTIYCFDQLSYVPIDQFVLGTITSIGSMAIPSGGFITATSGTENKVSIVNTITGAETSLNTSAMLSTSIFDGFGTLYFCDAKNGQLLSMDTASFYLSGSYPVGNIPNDLVALLKNNQIIVSLQGDKAIGIFDLVSKKLDKKYNIPVGDSSNHPMKIFYLESSKLLWVLNNLNLINVVDLSAKKVIKTLTIPTGDYVDFSVDDASIYLLSRTGTISILDINTNSLIKTFETTIADASSLNYQNNLLYILSSKSNKFMAFELEGRLVYDFSGQMK